MLDKLVCVDRKRHTTRAKFQSSWDDSPPRIYLQSLFTLVETLSRSRVSGFRRSGGKHCHGRRPICTPRCQQMSDEGRREQPHLYRLVIVTDYYVPDESGG